MTISPVTRGVYFPRDACPSPLRARPHRVQHMLSARNYRGRHPSCNTLFAYATLMRISLMIAHATCSTMQHMVQRSFGVCNTCVALCLPTYTLELQRSCLQRHFGCQRFPISGWKQGVRMTSCPVKAWENGSSEGSQTDTTRQTNRESSALHLRLRSPRLN